MKPFILATSGRTKMTAEDVAKAMNISLLQATLSLERIKEEMRDSRIWLNDVYQVCERYVPEDRHGAPCDVVHLSIKRLDQQPIHDWRDLQAIKTMLVGPENEAVEIYPAESRVVDTANQYHLWVLDDPKARFPMGWDSERMVSSLNLGGSVQRPFDEPADPAMRAAASRFTAEYRRDAGGTPGLELCVVTLSAYGPYQLYRHEAEALFWSIGRALGYVKGEGA
jgi:hypothetical protein